MWSWNLFCLKIEEAESSRQLTHFTTSSSWCFFFFFYINILFKHQIQQDYIKKRFPLWLWIWTTWSKLRSSKSLQPARDTAEHRHNNTATAPPCDDITQSTVPTRVHQTGLREATLGLKLNTTITLVRLRVLVHGFHLARTKNSGTCVSVCGGEFVEGWWFVWC